MMDNELRTHIKSFKDSEDNFVEFTIMVDRYGDKEFFRRLVDSHKDNKFVVLRLVDGE